MASDPAELQRDAPREAKSALAPLAGSRAQSLQRLQIGLFGLAAMVLLVGLANIILTNAKENQARVVPEAAATVAADADASDASDPLADRSLRRTLGRERKANARLVSAEHGRQQT